MIYLFYGSDQFTIHETLRGLRDRLASSDPVADLNFQELAGERLTVSELRSAADALPFMGERRLVAVPGMVGRCGAPGRGRGDQALARELIDYLPQVPSSTRLVFLDGPLTRGNPVLKWAKGPLANAPDGEKRVVVREFVVPSAGALVRWLSDRAAAMGGQLSPDAAEVLAQALAGDSAADLRRAESELGKLMSYAGDRAVSREDVELLVTPVSAENVFRLVDALGARNGPTAATLLHELLATGEQPLRLLGLIGRQFRLLVHTRALLDEGVPNSDLAARLKVPPFVVRRLQQQSGRFSLPFLRAALQRLRDIDTDIKTGRTDAVLALDLFVAGVCHTGEPR